MDRIIGTPIVNTRRFIGTLPILLLTFSVVFMVPPFFQGRLLGKAAITRVLIAPRKKSVNPIRIYTLQPLDCYYYSNLCLSCQARITALFPYGLVIISIFSFAFSSFSQLLISPTESSTNFAYIMVLLLFYSGHFADWRSISGMVYWFLQARNNNNITKILHHLTHD